MSSITNLDLSPLTIKIEPSPLGYKGYNRCEVESVALNSDIIISVCDKHASVLNQPAVCTHRHDPVEYLIIMDLETTVYISVGVLGGACALLTVALIVALAQLSSLKKRVTELQNGNRLRVQKLKVDPSDKNHAFHNPTLSPDEELSKRGYSMYMGSDGDLESGRGTERQTGGQFVEELSRELEQRQSRQGQPPPFLLQAIEESKRRSRSLANPVVNGRTRASETNPNFIY